MIVLYKDEDLGSYGLYDMDMNFFGLCECVFDF